MSYKALYRKYRPQSFSEVYDQDHIVRTLKNAIIEGRVSHAYLFSGPRGVGKTSVAKIMAKAVCCPNTKNGEACGICDICKGISDSSISDVIEIDAASNNGVDEIRDLRDKVRYLPSECKYKVYIIDEVHMLTTAAFNALLKTLEEPPKHVIFILCTTELQKVPQTIQSRCQRFEFHLISKAELKKRVKEVCATEVIKIDSDAVDAIADIAEGGMRDALSLLDQCSSYAGLDHITIDDVLEVSGKLSNDTLIDMSNAIASHDSFKAISLLDELLRIGKEIPKIVNGLIVFYKDILVIKNVSKSITKSGYDSPKFNELVNSLSNINLYKYIDILSQALNDMRYAENQKLYTELAIIKMADLEGALPKATEKPVVKQEVVKPQVVKPVEKPVEVVKPEVKEEVIPQTKEEPKPIEIKAEPVKAQDTPKPTSSFDISIVENVLNNAKKELKESIKSRWGELVRSKKGLPENKYGLLIEDGVITACSSDTMIITFSEVGYCNLCMKKDNYEGIKKVIHEFLGYKMDFLAITLDAWKKVSDEFVKQYRINTNSGIKGFIKLSPVYIEGYDIKEKEEVKDDRFKEVENLFGDILEVE